ncbi:MAG: hypothetical protein ACL9RN_15915 [Cylindrospermopsis raciborskii]|jgi:hypothetical protein|uniref:hypothetical protein n=1 Tax=Cylindrospermopsis raciborskii TaxID=77022 RepID=UPI003D10413B
MEQNQLFAQLSPEEAAIVRGGGLIEAASYLIVMQSLLPDIAESAEVLNTAFLLLIGVLSLPTNNNINSVNNAPIVGSPGQISPALGSPIISSFGTGLI